MILLTANQLTRQFDADPVLDRVSFEVRPGEKIGLVGPNGAGKTTLLKILAGHDEPDEGRLDLHPSVRVAMLEQETQFADDRTLLDEAKSGLAPLYGLQAEAEEMAARIAAETDEAASERWHKRYDAVQHELQRLSAYNIDHRVDEVLSGLGFTRDQYNRQLTTFSGGQQNRAILARMLLAAPDVMLLDEPTNHLDIGATEWLEEYLVHCEQSLIIVSHDRYFLDKVTNRILELYAGRITDYPGNFSAYWKLKDERNKVQERTFEKQQELIARTEEFIVKNRYGQKHAQAADREKKLERLERVERPREIPSVSMAFGEAKRTGDWVIQAEGLTKGFGQPLFKEVTLQILRGDRLGIFGPNGSGKTTLLRTLIGELAPDAGVVRFGTHVEFAYYDQQLTSVDPAADIIEAVRPANNPQMTPGQIRDLVARFGLRRDIVFQTVGSLSGGEKSKVALARLAALNANVLVLDEPTNHLDLWACGALEQALLKFEGTVLFVSHDRYFLDRVATSIIALEPDRWRLYEGNYSAYVDSLHRAQAEADQRSGERRVAEAAAKCVKAAETRETSRRKRRFPYRKVEDLEAEIAETEEQVQKLRDELANPDVFRDGQRAKATTQLYEQAESQLARLYEHWEEAVELN